MLISHWILWAPSPLFTSGWCSSLKATLNGTFLQESNGLNENKQSVRHRLWLLGQKNETRHSSLENIYIYIYIYDIHVYIYICIITCICMETYWSPVGHLKLWACYWKVFTNKVPSAKRVFVACCYHIHPGTHAQRKPLARRSWNNAGDVFRAFGNATIQLTSNLLVRCVHQSLVGIPFQTLQCTFNLSLSYLSSWTSQCQVATSACRSLMSFMVLERTWQWIL